VDKLITTADAAKKLKVSPRRVIALIESGRLPATRLGHVYAIKASDLALVKVRPTGRPKKSG
jgi:excisionase family DNA binding protein